MKPLIFGDYTKIITHFISHFSKMLILFVVSLTIKIYITLRKRGRLSIFDLLNHEESMGFHSRSGETILHVALFVQIIF